MTRVNGNQGTSTSALRCTASLGTHARCQHERIEASAPGFPATSRSRSARRTLRRRRVCFSCSCWAFCLLCLSRSWAFSPGLQAVSLLLESNCKILRRILGTGGKFKCKISILRRHKLQECESCSSAKSSSLSRSSSSGSVRKASESAFSPVDWSCDLQKP